NIKQSQFCCSCAFGDGLRSVYFRSPSAVRRLTPLLDLPLGSEEISVGYMSHRGNELSPGGFVCRPLPRENSAGCDSMSAFGKITTAAGAADPFLKNVKQSQFCCSCAFGDGLRSVYFPVTFGCTRVDAFVGSSI